MALVMTRGRNRLLARQKGPSIVHIMQFSALIETVSNSFFDYFLRFSIFFTYHGGFKRIILDSSENYYSARAYLAIYISHIVLRKEPYKYHPDFLNNYASTFT